VIVTPRLGAIVVAVVGLGLPLVVFGGSPALVVIFGPPVVGMVLWVYWAGASLSDYVVGLESRLPGTWPSRWSTAPGWQRQFNLPLMISDLASMLRVMYRRQPDRDLETLRRRFIQRQAISLLVLTSVFIFIVVGSLVTGLIHLYFG
jgi:hypothetical protein